MPDELLKGPILQSIQRASLKYAWRGIPMAKDPFDLALYTSLLFELKPRTVVEFGSFAGGSAAWFADMLQAMDIPATVHSIDLRRPKLDHPGVTFYEGDANSPAPEIFADLPHPWLVVEDSSHQASTTLAVLRFLHEVLKSGDYVVVEDGIVTAMGIDKQFGGGPHAGMSEFLEEHPGDYEVDRRFCDFFGRNVTFNPDGYLKRI
jgi:cephalosporin hydroxylase